MNATEAPVGFQISKEVFQRFRDLLYRESGISLSDRKQSLLISRLSKRLRKLKLKSFEAYYDYVTAGGGNSDEFVQMLDLLSTNKTDFFREQIHFDFFAEHILPTLEDRKRVNIWSSACSSGEEPYSIAMTLHESVSQPEKWNCRILASDISTRVLAKAARGVYDLERLDGMDTARIHRHFLRGKQSQDKVKVKKHLSKMVTFRRINLMDEKYPIKTSLDLIFCRNVMIYFDRPTQQFLVNNFYRYLKPGGYLFIGHSESLQWVESPFVSIVPTVYKKE